MEAFVEASAAVTSILARMAAGETVEASEIENARQAQIVATSRYMSEMAGSVLMAVETARGLVDQDEDSPDQSD